MCDCHFRVLYKNSAGVPSSGKGKINVKTLHYAITRIQTPEHIRIVYDMQYCVHGPENFYSHFCTGNNIFIEYILQTGK